MKNTKIVWLLVAVVIFFLSMSVFSRIYANREKNPFSKEMESYASLGGDFQFLDQDSNSTRLSDLWKEKPLAIYFGFTRCPDVCPSSLASMQAAINLMEPKYRSAVQIVFISADPEYDTPQKLGPYVEFFINNGVGLVGDLDTTLQMAGSYGAYINKVDVKDSAMGYTVDHSTRWYLVDKEGAILSVFDHALNVQEIANKLTSLAKLSSH